MSEKSLYQILGVSPDASQADIRTAYLKLAKEWHPDRNPGNGAEAERRFKEIAHAYDVLSDPDKRAAYDAAAGTGEHTAGFEGTMDEDAAFDLFISVLLDLAFELAENGADQITIYQALLDMGCPSGTAKTLAQRANKLGGDGKAGRSREDASKAKRQGSHGNGGGANGGKKDASTAASEPIDPDATFPAGPWSRWFARSLDLLVGATVASPLIGWLFQWLWSLEPAPLRLAAYVVLVAPIPFIVDAIIVGIFGNSLGKALLKIRVVTKIKVEGHEVVKPIAFGDALCRNLEMWLKGFWGSIPFVAAIPQFLAYLKVSEGKKVAWDVRGNGSSDGPEMPDFDVIRQKTRWELIAAFVVCVFVLPIAANFFAATANFGGETFLTSVSNSSEISVNPNSANKLKPINLNEIIFQSLPTNGRMSWDQFSESNVEWQFGGSPSLYAEGGAKRSGIARIRTDGKICTVNSWGKKEAVWSVFLENFENYEEGPSSVRIYPGIRDGDDIYYYTDGKNEILDMKKFNPTKDNGCEFRIESLHSSKVQYTRRRGQI